jgi:hypothetical protein
VAVTKKQIKEIVEKANNKKENKLNAFLKKYKGDIELLLQKMEDHIDKKVQAIADSDCEASVFAGQNMFSLTIQFFNDMQKMDDHNRAHVYDFIARQLSLKYCHEWVTDFGVFRYSNNSVILQWRLEE